jgi:crotonobetainyl-CoA:carnitine CoA-transferase CaiB-like acyl-CoA transferase
MLARHDESRWSKRSMSDGGQPLAGVKVLDFSQNLPGPYATFLLACWGAEVIKVEPPKGDPGRFMEPFFSIVNRGKKSVVIDLREESGKASLEALIRWCDVLVEGFRPGVLERLGGGFERAKELNPKIVYCSISAFGQDGPLRDHPGHDLNLQALSGVCHLERDGDGVPGRTMLPIADLSSSLLAVSSICAALASKRGAPQRLDVAMADGVLSWASVWGVGVDLKTNAQKQLGRGLLVDTLTRPLLDHLARLKLYAMPHYGVFRTKDDRHLTIGIVDEGHFWKSLCEELGLGGFAKLPMGARIAAGPALRPVIARRIRGKKLDEWLSRFARSGVPVSAVLTPEEAARDAQVRARGLVDERGWIGSPLPGSKLPSGDPPKLGEHTSLVLDHLSSSRGMNERT